VTQAVLTGGCLCGGVRFELTEPPVSANYCHCTRCQRRTGTAASAQARVEPGTVRIVAGEDLVRRYDPEPGGWGKLFCVRCGSALFSAPSGSDGPRAVRMGAFDGDPGIRPQARQHVASAASWEPIPDDGLPRYDGSVPS
jgi:hypothetical protein